MPNEKTSALTNHHPAATPGRTSAPAAPTRAQGRRRAASPVGGGQGTASDIAILAREFATLRERMERILAERTGQSVARIHEDTQRDFWMSAAEARDYGLIDEVAGA